MTIDSLRKKFEKIIEKYHGKRDFFRRVINSWKQKEQSDHYDQGNDLMIQFEATSRELHLFFSGQGGLAGGHKEATQKVKQLGALYKKLALSTKPFWRDLVELVFFYIPLLFCVKHFVFNIYHVPTGSAEPNILVGDRLVGNKMAYLMSDVKHGDLVTFDEPEFVYDSSSTQALWQKWVGLAVPILGLKEGPKNLVKRVIGLPGDYIEGKVENGKAVIYRNGVKLEEPYVNPYPLIEVRRRSGVPVIEMLHLPLISKLLRYEEKRVRCTYVEGIDYQKQPFYKVDKNDVAIDPNSQQPYLYYPRDPSQDFYGTTVDVFSYKPLPPGKYWVQGDSRRNSRDCRFWGMPVDRSLIRGRASLIIWSIDSDEALSLIDMIKHPIDFWTKKIRWNRLFKPLWKWNGYKDKNEQ